MTNQNTLPLSDDVISNDTIPQTFQFDNFPIHATDRSGAIWFFANDICAVLEINNSRQAIFRLDDDEKSEVAIKDSLGRSQNVNIISESGLYALVMTSRKPEAKRFKKWVTSEVLPTIRKTGSYSIEQEPERKKIDHRGRPRLAPTTSPNYALASDLAAQAAQAVFDAVLNGGQGWLANKRFLMSTNPKGDFIFKPLGAGDFITSPDKLTQLIAQGCYTSQKQLVDLLQACLDQIAKYWLHKA